MKPRIDIIHSLRQTSHDTLKCNQSHRICGERPEETRQKPTPEPTCSALLVDRHSSILPSRKPLHAVLETAAKRIRHDPLLNHIGWVRRQPEDLCRQATSPEVDGWGRESGTFCEDASKDIVAAPPEEEETAEK